MDEYKLKPVRQFKKRQGAYLPHWTMDRAIYSITFRLHDSLPQVVWLSWLKEHENIIKTAHQMNRSLSKYEEKRLQELYSEKVESYLDAGVGECYMKDARVAELVANGLRFFDGQRYHLIAWCVMPNHVHVVFKPNDDFEICDILHSWKSFTANKANQLLNRVGAFWQEEYHDHMVRDEDELRRMVEYVLSNPRNAQLNDWKWVSEEVSLPKEE